MVAVPCTASCAHVAAKNKLHPRAADVYYIIIPTHVFFLLPFRAPFLFVLPGSSEHDKRNAHQTRHEIALDIGLRRLNMK